MKVALLFFGQPRFLDNKLTFESHKNNILNKYDTDVFCHTWWSPDQNSYNVSSWSNINSCFSDSNSIIKIIEMYKPKVLQFQESINFSTYNKHNFENVIKNHKWAFVNKNNILSHLYSFSKVGEIIEEYVNNTNAKYDFVVVSRLDAHILKFPNLQELNYNKFYLPNHHDKFPDNLFVFGYDFIKFLNIFQNIEELSNKVWQPSAESFKWENYKKYFVNPLVQHENIYSEFVRNS